MGKVQPRSVQASIREGARRGWSEPTMPESLEKLFKTDHFGSLEEKPTNVRQVKLAYKRELIKIVLQIKT